MTYTVHKRRTGLRLLVLALIVAAIPLPVLAEETKQAPTTPGLHASIKPAAAAAATSALRESKSAAQTPAQTPVQAPDRSSLGSSSFFKKPVGVFVLGVIAAGTGYAIYSASHDRIPPSNR